MGPEYFESLDKPELVHVANRLLETAVELWEQTHQDSHNSSKPPSSDSPYTTSEHDVEKNTDGNGQRDNSSNDLNESMKASDTSDADDAPRNDVSPSETSGGERHSRGKQPEAPGGWRSEPLSAEEVVGCPG